MRAGLLAALRAVYYLQRTWPALRVVWRRMSETEFAGWLTKHGQRDRHFGDLKRAAPLAAVRTALDGAAVTSRAVASVPVWETAYSRRWSNAAVRGRVAGLELSTEDRVVYQQVFAPEFRERWTAYLEHLSLCSCRWRATTGHVLALPPSGGWR
ncbi:hypothetical protein AB0M58_38890 [Streptomyces bobili]|uniref:hypothetical protein n=1 Tax=Streptomyces bobili TaxID=67280 RepID=UPI003444B34B